MADNTARYGFRWHKGNQNTCPKGMEFPVADAYQAKADDTTTNVDLNIGDPVKLVAGGTVALANTTDVVFGIIVGIARVYSSTLGVVAPINRVPGATTGGGLLDRQTRVLVVPAKAGVWEIDADDAVTATTEAAYRALVNKNVEHTCVADTTNANLPKANPKIDISATATTAGLGWRIVGVSKTADNRDFSGANVKMLVMVNDSNEAASAATNVAGV